MCAGPQGTEEALKLARRYKVPSLIDADIAPTDTSRLVCLADHAVFSERGLQAFVDEPTIEKRLQTAHQKSGGWVAVTAGDKGSYWLDDQSGLVSCPADQVNAVDTCGAGDVFHGAFSVAMVERMKMEKAMSFASAAATLKCLKFGGSLGVPDRLAVDRFIEEQ
jgi:sulfofructose kinase